jgi:hypothetical protein
LRIWLRRSGYKNHSSTLGRFALPSDAAYLNNRLGSRVLALKPSLTTETLPREWGYSENHRQKKI